MRRSALLAVCVCACLTSCTPSGVESYTGVVTAVDTYDGSRTTYTLTLDVDDTAVPYGADEAVVSEVVLNTQLDDVRCSDSGEPPSSASKIVVDGPVTFEWSPRRGGDDSSPPGLAVEPGVVVNCR